MVDEKKQKIVGDFKTLSYAEPFKSSKNTYYVSYQKISQDNGSSSDHLVIKKQGLNEDGSARGDTRQIFIPKDDVEKVLEHIVKFVNKNKK